MEKQIKIGCEAYIVKDDQIFLGKRGNVYGSGTWALPGGHLEHMERADECLARELQEEIGVTVDPATFTLIALTDDVQPENGVHYIHITYRVDLGDQIPVICEPDICAEWKWFDLDKMPEHIFAPHKKIFETVASGVTYQSKKV